MVENMLEYKCPSCGGALEFNSALQKMKCLYCDNEFDLETLKALDEAAKITSGEDQMNWNIEKGTEFSSDEAGALNTYICKSCGGEIITDETTGATSCPFCGNPVVVADKFAGGLKPDFIIPFKLSKEDAKNSLKKHFEGKRLLPKVFKTENHIDEIKGVYVPFWMFDADVNGTVTYDATTVDHWHDSNYDYTRTNHFEVFRQGNVSFTNIPVDASTKMADDLMQSIEPFNFNEAVDFQTAYFAGYLADKYDVSVEESLPKINSRVKTSTEDSFRSTINNIYTSVTPKASFVNVQNGSSKYALLPVWILNTTWNGEKFTFAMNGQTGKFVGNLPMDKGLRTKYLLGTFLGAGAVGALTSLLIQLLF